jgi:amidase
MQPMTEIAFQSATALADAIRRREIGSRELLDHYIERIERLDPAINAVVVRDFDRALALADAADAALARGEDLGPLHGVPMTVKESFHLAGTPTTFGFPEFRDNLASSNATVVDRLTGSGAVIFGKTNVPPGLMDGQSWNAVYGRTNNPWDLGRTPGGSSGGSAAALAAGLTGLELGSDIASSIRNPAHYCGVFGHKPSWGIAPQTGHMLTPVRQATDIAVVGPMARSAADLELALGIIAGPDGEAAKAWSLALPEPRQSSLKDFRVAVVSDDPFAEVDGPVRDQIEALGRFLEREGAEVGSGARPDFDSHAVYIHYMIMLRAAAAAGAPDEEFAEAQARSRGLDWRTREVGLANAYGLALSHRDWLRMNEQRLGMAARWAAFFERYDVLLCPVLATAAFPHSDVPPQQRTLTVNGREVPFENQLYWAGYAGLVHLPASVAPVGLSPEGLPIGVQIIGPRYGDLTTLRFARLLEQSYRAFQPPPGL